MSLLLARQGQVFSVVLSGAISPSGALVRTNIFKVLTGALSPAGAVAKTTSKVLTGAITPVGVVVKTALKALSGAVSPTANVLKTMLRVLSGVLAPAGAVEATKEGGGVVAPEAGELTEIVHASHETKIS